MHLAIKERKWLKKIKCTIKIQSFYRKILAKKEAEYLRMVRRHLAKCKVALRL